MYPIFAKVVNKCINFLQLDIRRNDYFGNYIRMLTNLAQEKFAKLGKFHNSSLYDFQARATMVNAFYKIKFNTMGRSKPWDVSWGSTPDHNILEVEGLATHLKKWYALRISGG